MSTRAIAEPDRCESNYLENPGHWVKRTAELLIFSAVRFAASALKSVNHPVLHFLFGLEGKPPFKLAAS